MTNIQHFKIVRSVWENENGDLYYTITDGVERKGMFATPEEAEANMERIIINWRRDS